MMSHIILTPPLPGYKLSHFLRPTTSPWSLTYFMNGPKADFLMITSSSQTAAASIWFEIWEGRGSGLKKFRFFQATFQKILFFQAN